MPNHFYIGLGGAGGNVLREIRKAKRIRKDLFDHLDASYRDAFLYVDSQEAELNAGRQKWRVLGESIELDQNERLNIKQASVENMLETIAGEPSLYDWLTEGGQLDIQQYFGGALDQIEGAGQRRRFGRWLFWKNKSEIRQRIASKVSALIDGSDGSCQFHVFATLGGGTGSGGIVDLAALIRSLFPDSLDYKIKLYVLLSLEIDDPARDVGYFQLNQYAALTDINTMMLGTSSFHDIRNDNIADLQLSTPINSCKIVTGLNERNQSLDKATQEQLLAEWVLEVARLEASGGLSTSMQAGLTGEDALAVLPGEPLANSERSYRFGSVGIQRWQVPDELVFQHLSINLAESVANRVLTNAWKDDEGYKSVAGNSETFAPSLGEFSLDLKSSSGLATDSRSEWDRQASSALNLFAKTEAEERIPLKPDRMDSFFEAYINEGVLGNGLSAYYVAREEEVGSLAEKAMGQAADFLQSQLEAQQFSFEVARKYLSDLTRVTEAEIDRSNTRNEKLLVGDSEKLQRNLEQFSKLGFLSKLFGMRQKLLSRRAELLAKIYGDRHEAEAIKFHVRVLQRFRSSLTDDLIPRMDQWIALLEEARRKVQSDNETVRSALNGNVPHVKREHDAEMLAEYEKLFRLEKVTINRCAELFSKELFRDGFLAPLAGGAATTKSRLEFAVKDAVQRTHDDLNKKPNLGLKRILGVNILSLLQQRHGQVGEALREEVNDFVKRAVAALRIDAASVQPSALLQTEAPPMPARKILIHVPRAPAGATREAGPGQQFRNDLVAAFKGADSSIEIADTEEIESREIIVVSSLSWMAARFAKVVRRLREHYDLNMHKEVDGGIDPRYFCHIDQRWRSRHSLYLETEAEVRTRFSELYLLADECGLIEHQGTNAYLLKENDGITEPIEMGPSGAPTQGLNLLEMNARVSALHSEVKRRKEQGAFEKIRTNWQKKLSADKTQHGATSEHHLAIFNDWKRLENLLQQFS